VPTILSDRSRVPAGLVTALDVALIFALVLALLSWFFDPFRLAIGPVPLSVTWGRRPVVVLVALLGLRILLRPDESAPPRILPRVALALAAMLVPLASIEAALALVGVPAGEPVFVLHGGGGQEMRAGGSMVTDADLLWRFQPGTIFNGRRINALGFLDREVSAEKAPGVKRVISLGDSCSGQGMPPYSGYLNALLQQQSPDGGPWEAFNAAVHGYTVLQGLRLFQTRVQSWQADIVTVFFGWNDHWLAGEEDAVRMARAGSPLETTLRNAVARKRLYTLLARPAPPPQGGRIRVPAEAYATGLRTLIRAIRASGAVPLILTAPRDRAISSRMVHLHQARSVEEAMQLHDDYVKLTRAVAREEDAPLVDLAAKLDGQGREVFSNDGIHYTQAGLERIAGAIDEGIRALVPLLPKP
jgi:lysophospholipase L1-like esterase